MHRISLTLILAVATACASSPRVELAAAHQQGVADRSAPVVADPTDTTTPAAGEVPASSTTSESLLAGGVDPDTLTTTPDGGIAVQPTPAALQDRRLPTRGHLAPPETDDFTFTIQPLTGESLRRSTWREICPVPVDDLRYITLSFWGFDGGHHTGELIVAASEAEPIVSVFRRLHEIRFPIEEMRIVTPIDVVARPTGDSNNTASFVCRSVTGGSRFSEHAYGLAIDINPFHNPYHRNDAVIPALASSYLERSQPLPGMIVPGDPAGDAVIAAFADIGWAWGGNWSSLKDYQHFAKNNR